MPPKEDPERACEECIHFFACSMQCGEQMAQRSATGCECYEPIKSSMAYYVGTLDGAKGKIPNRLRELAEADKDGRVVVLPCKVGDTVYQLRKKTHARGIGISPRIVSSACVWADGSYALTHQGMSYCQSRDLGKTWFLTREEAEKALQQMEGENGIENSKSYQKKDEPDGALCQ